MQTIQVRTTQNVFIQYPLASVGDRIIAHIIDNLIMIAYVLPVVIAFVNYVPFSWWVYVLVIGLPVLFYTLALCGASPSSSVKSCPAQCS